jgi:phosphate transport system substrate-binding protein
VIKVSKQKGEPGVEPTLATALDNSYPISRPLYLYTLGEPTGAIQEFIQWVQSPAGQKIVEQEGYVSVTDQPAAK